MNTTSRRPMVPRRPPTLWRNLWMWTLLAIILSWLTLYVVTYLVTRHEAEEITDGQLVSAARLLLTLPAATGITTSPPVNRDAQSYTAEIAASLWQDGKLQSHTGAHDLNGVNMPPPIGFATLHLGERTWRRYSTESADGRRQAAVMIGLDSRNSLAKHMAGNILRPALVVLPLFALLTAWALRRGIRPLRQLAERIDRLDIRQRERLPQDVHYAEFVSATEAINGLLERSERQTERERQFAADLAHELRTPLMALSLQAETLQRSGLDEHSAERLEALHGLALKAGHILTQLLAFARAQRPAADNGDAAQAVDLTPLTRSVLADFAQMMHESGHDIAFEAPDTPVQVTGHPLLLALALRNLVDNALRHTPTGTQIKVSVSESSSSTQIEVWDDGPAHPGAPAPAPPPAPKDADSSSGLGIGLRLVERIADWHGAQLQRERDERHSAYRLMWSGRK